MHDGRSLRTSKHWTRHLSLTKIAMTIRLGRYRRTHKLASCHLQVWQSNLRLFHNSITCSYGHQTSIPVNTKSNTGCNVKPFHPTLLPATLYGTTPYRGAGESLARPTSRCILFDGENISFDASLVLYI